MVTHYLLMCCSEQPAAYVTASVRFSKRRKTTPAHPQKTLPTHCNRECAADSLCEDGSEGVCVCVWGLGEPHWPFCQFRFRNNFRPMIWFSRQQFPIFLKLSSPAPVYSEAWSGTLGWEEQWLREKLAVFHDWFVHQPPWKATVSPRNGLACHWARGRAEAAVWHLCHLLPTP